MFYVRILLILAEDAAVDTRCAAVHNCKPTGWYRSQEVIIMGLASYPTRHIPDSWVGLPTWVERNHLWVDRTDDRVPSIQPNRNSTFCPKSIPNGRGHSHNFSLCFLASISAAPAVLCACKTLYGSSHNIRILHVVTYDTRCLRYHHWITH